MAEETAKTKETAKTLSVADVQKKAAKDSRKIHLNDRVKLEVIEDAGHYKKGQIIHPHKVYAEDLLSKKIAKEVK